MREQKYKEEVLFVSYIRSFSLTKLFTRNIKQFSQMVRLSGAVRELLVMWLDLVRKIILEGLVTLHNYFSVFILSDVKQFSVLLCVCVDVTTAVAAA